MLAGITTRLSKTSFRNVLNRLSGVGFTNTIPLHRHRYFHQQKKIHHHTRHFDHIFISLLANSVGVFTLPLVLQQTLRFYLINKMWVIGVCVCTYRMYIIVRVYDNVRYMTCTWHRMRGISVLKTVAIGKLDTIMEVRTPKGICVGNFA